MFAPVLPLKVPACAVLKLDTADTANECCIYSTMHNKFASFSSCNNGHHCGRFAKVKNDTRTAL